MTTPADPDQDACDRLIRDADKVCPYTPLGKEGHDTCVHTKGLCDGTGRVPRFPTLVRPCPSQVNCKERGYCVRHRWEKQQRYREAPDCNGTGLVANVTVEGLLLAGNFNVKITRPHKLNRGWYVKPDVCDGRSGDTPRLALSRAFVAAEGLA